MNTEDGAKSEIVRSSGLNLQEFCNMKQLYKLLDHWSKSCGMATVIVDNEGNQVSEDFGMTEFCKAVQSCENGKNAARTHGNPTYPEYMSVLSDFGIFQSPSFSLTDKCWERFWQVRLFR